jgi:hypothetical protein
VGGEYPDDECQCVTNERDHLDVFRPFECVGGGVSITGCVSVTKKVKLLAMLLTHAVQLKSGVLLQGLFRSRAASVADQPGTHINLQIEVVITKNLLMQIKHKNLSTPTHTFLG